MAEHLPSSAQTPIRNPLAPAGAVLPAPFVTAAAACAAAADTAQPLVSRLAGLITQIDALLASTEPLPQWIDSLWPALWSLADAGEARFSRKPLPLVDEELRLLLQCRRAWCGMALLCEQAAGAVAANAAALYWQRAANAWRRLVATHVWAAYAYPDWLDARLLQVLAQADAEGQLTLKLADPALPQLGVASVQGYLVWAFWWRLIEPERFGMAQLAVCERMISRWRELCELQLSRDSDPKARYFDLARLAPAAAPQRRWLPLRTLSRKLRQRADALRAGETPQQLKLGAELSASACQRLLRDLELALAGIRSRDSGEHGDLALVFGSEQIYALVTGKALQARPLDLTASRLAHQRLGVFGFDRVSQVGGRMASPQVVAGEAWQAHGGRLWRAASAASLRHAGGRLLAVKRDGQVMLGALSGLQMHEDGRLSAQPTWFAGRVEALRLPVPKVGEKVPVIFLLHAETGGGQLIWPPALALRLGESFGLPEASLPAITPYEVLERGADFVRYAWRTS